MIFKIADGREYFYQWDIDRQLIVSDPTITEVHFCNRTDVCSLVVEVVDGVANVPNKLLQSGFNVRVFGYDGKATMHEATFEVKARTQPTDYVYTETEIKRYSDLEKRIDEMEAATDEAIGEAVNNYLDEHPITMDGYATEEYVNEAVSNVKPDLTGYATEAYVDEAVKNVEVDLTDYAKKTDIPDVSDFISEIPDEYITESDLNAKGYATKTELNDKANANHTHSEYAKATHTHSTADVDGLQKVLNKKATQADIDKAIELHDHRYDYAPIDHTHGDEYAAKTHTHSYNNLLDKPTIPSVEGLASEAYVRAAVANIDIPEVNLDGYATEAYVTAEIAKAQLNGEDVDLSGYATKDDLKAKADKNHTHSDYAPVVHTHSQYLTEHQSLAAYAKKTELFSKNYNDLTNKPAIPSIAGLATEEYVDTTDSNVRKYVSQYYVDKNLLTTLRADDKAEYKKYVDDAIADIESPEGGGGDADLSNYYTKEEIDTTVAALEEADKIKVLSPGKVGSDVVIVEAFRNALWNNPEKHKIRYKSVEYTYY